MKQRHELLCRRSELERFHKQEKIVADALSARIVQSLTTGADENTDPVELVLATEVLAQSILRMRSAAREIGEISSELETR